MAPRQRRLNLRARGCCDWAAGCAWRPLLTHQLAERCNGACVRARRTSAACALVAQAPRQVATPRCAARVRSRLRRGCAARSSGGSHTPGSYTVWDGKGFVLLRRDRSRGWLDGSTIVRHSPTAIASAMSHSKVGATWCLAMGTVGRSTCGRTDVAPRRAVFRATKHAPVPFPSLCARPGAAGAALPPSGACAAPVFPPPTFLPPSPGAATPCRYPQLRCRRCRWPRAAARRRGCWPGALRRRPCAAAAPPLCSRSQRRSPSAPRC